MRSSIFFMVLVAVQTAIAADNPLVLPVAATNTTNNFAVSDNNHNVPLVAQSKPELFPSNPQTLQEQPPLPGESLEDAWRVALGNDQRIEASRFNIAAARSTLAAALAERFPSLKLGAEYYVLSDQPMLQASLPAPFPTVEMPFIDRSAVGFQTLVTQPLYTFGRIKHGICAAEESVKANEADFCRTTLDIKMAVAELYVLVLRARRMIDVVDAKVISLEAHAQDVAAYYEKGLVPQNDLLAAQVALANARQEALQAHNLLQVAYASYNRALGRPLESPVNIADLQTTGTPGNIEDLTARAMQLRPELSALSAQVRALHEQAAALRAKKAPQIGLVGGYIYQQNEYLDPNGMALGMVGVDWTPFDSGRVSNQASSLTEKAEATTRLLRDAQSQIALEVRQKWLDFQTALQRIEAVRAATTQADENVRVARDRYQHQAGTNTEVLDAETLRVQAYTNFYNSTYEAVLAEMRLRRAVGDL